MSLDIITRARWGAREKGLEVYQTTWAKRKGFMTHYSAGPPDQTVKTIQEYHLSKGWGDIGYNFLIDQGGRIYEGRKHTWNAVGAHSHGENTIFIGVCFIGRNSDVTDEAKIAFRLLYDEAVRRKGSGLTKTYHSAHGPTACPGDNLRNWVKGGMRVTDMTAFSDDDVKKILAMQGSADVMEPPRVNYDGSKVTEEQLKANRKVTLNTYLRWILEDLRSFRNEVKEGNTVVTDEQLLKLGDRVAGELRSLTFSADQGVKEDASPTVVTKASPRTKK